MKTIRDLTGIMEQLRDPASGCPWDREQTLATIAPYTLEEAYEVVDAIERQDMPGLAQELGDLLFHIVFYAQLAREQGCFDFDDIVDAITEKMIRRHPHVFGEEHIDSATAQSAAWEAHKAVEENRKDGETGMLDSIGPTMPALLRALKLQKRAAYAGLDWQEIHGVLDKLEEEIREAREALSGDRRLELHAEVGDLLFSCVNLARHAGVDPEMALRAANARFTGRCHAVETMARESNRQLGELLPEELDYLWEQAKAHEKKA